MVAVAADGAVYVTRKQGDVVMLRDQNGKASVPKTVAELDGVHGIAIKGKQVWLATVRDLFVADIAAGGSFSQPKRILTGMRPRGHEARTIAFGPDGWLYVSIGSTCNVCDDPRDENAVIWRVKPDGTGKEVFARGLRNTIGFDWHPVTKQMFGWDHGRDWLGDDYPLEEMNRLVKGGDYGWPFCTNDKRPDNNYKGQPQGTSKDEFCKRSLAPVLTHTAHSAPIWALFYTGNIFPAEYKNDMLVAFHGSWNRTRASGHEVMRVRFRDGKPVGLEPLVSGFLINSGRARFGRPAGLAQMKDGSLLISDDMNGVIYRVTYQKR